MARKQNGGYNASILTFKRRQFTLWRIVHIQRQLDLLSCVAPTLVALRLLVNVVRVTHLEAVKIEFHHLPFHKPVKRFQMKSNGCRDVQHTGLQSTQTRRNTGKQGAQTRGTQSAHLPKHPYISGCIIIVGYANQFKVTKN